MRFGDEFRNRKGFATYPAIALAIFGVHNNLLENLHAENDVLFPSIKTGRTRLYATDQKTAPWSIFRRPKPGAFGKVAFAPSALDARAWRKRSRSGGAPAEQPMSCHALEFFRNLR